MWGVIKRALQFIASNLYVTVDAVGFNVDGSSQYASGIGEQESVLVTNIYPLVTAEMSLPYNVQPCNAIDMDNIKDAEVLGTIHTREVQRYTHENEYVQTYMDKAIEMDDTQDVYEEFIDNDGPEDNLKFLDELQVENNVDVCPILNPTLE